MDARGYYDGIGAARDVIQNHLLQLLAFTAMEEPISFEPLNLQAEKIKVLSATRLAEPLDETTARGQYAGGWQGGLPVVGLLEEDGFAADSITETFAAITLEVDTRRWAGVPFYLRTGKRLGRRVTEIAVVFKRAPHLPFDKTIDRRPRPERSGHPRAARRGRHHAGSARRFPDRAWKSVTSTWTSRTARLSPSRPPEAYERLILDVLLGEPSLFPVNAEVELSWEILDPVLEHWAAGGKPEPYEGRNVGTTVCGRNDATHRTRMEATLVILDFAVHHHGPGQQETGRGT